MKFSKEVVNDIFLTYEKINSVLCISLKVNYRRGLKMVNLVAKINLTFVFYCIVQFLEYKLLVHLSTLKTPIQLSNIAWANRFCLFYTGTLKMFRKYVRTYMYDKHI